MTVELNSLSLFKRHPRPWALLPDPGQDGKLELHDSSGQPIKPVEGDLEVIAAFFEGFAQVKRDKLIEIVQTVLGVVVDDFNEFEFEQD